MKTNKLIFALFLVFFATNCVQKTSLKTVVVHLTIKGRQDIKTVGIRGNGKPLSWDKDFLMKTVVQDSLYTVTITARTAYKFAEIKFTVNGEFELQNKPNRRVIFNEKNDTTVYKAVFDNTK
jgi:hypothetical protein